MSKSNQTIPAGYHVYKGSEANAADLHDANSYYFEPDDYGEGDVFSEGYPTREEAAIAAHNWDAEHGAQ